MLTQSLQYKQWADRRTLDAVATIDAAKHPSSLAFARQQLNHIVRVDELFKARLLNEALPHDSTNSELVPPLAELDQRLSASNRWLRGYAETLSADQLAEVIELQFVDGKLGSLSRQEILFHLVNHGTYHRGAIGHALDLAGAQRPPDTYTMFIHAAEPQRRERA